MTARTLHRCALPLAVVACALAFVAGVDGAPSRAAFPCGGTFDLVAGSPKGYVRASATADCSGERGTIELTIRLLAHARGGPWRLVRSRTKMWGDLARPHRLWLTLPCPAGAVRATFAWGLRTRVGAPAATRTVRTKPIAVNARCSLKHP